MTTSRPLCVSSSGSCVVLPVPVAAWTRTECFCLRVSSRTQVKLILIGFRCDAGRNRYRCLIRGNLTIIFLFFGYNSDELIH